MTTKIPTASSDYTSNGMQCIYFDNGDGTGWKLYRSKEEAIQSWATQIWALRKKGAPFILSGVKEFEFENKGCFPTQVCPVSGNVLFYNSKIGYYRCQNSVWSSNPNKLYKANCSDKLKKLKIKMCGFLVEHVDIIGGGPFINYCCRNQRSYFKELFSTKERLDCHKNNWGIIRDTLVMIDFGTHFFGGLNTKQRAEIEKIQTQVNITKLGD